MVRQANVFIRWEKGGGSAFSAFPEGGAPTVDAVSAQYLESFKYTVV